jgi:hypothetical protein
MGFRLSRRVGKTTGINISGHGLSASFRTRIGSFNTDGFTLRTPFKGLTYRGSWFNGRIFGTRKIFTIPGLINCISITFCFLLKVAIIVLVILGLAIVGMVRGIVRLVRGRKPDEEPGTIPPTTSV